MKTIRFMGTTGLAAVLVAGGLVAGCGGGSSNGASLTHSELTARATAICTPVTNAVNAALGEVFGAPKPDPQAFADAVETTVLPEFEKQTTQLAALQPPSGVESAYSSYLTSAREVSAKLKADPAAPFNGDTQAFFGPSNAKAKAAGLPDVCLAGPPGG
jgi:hypothetical protein